MELLIHKDKVHEYTYYLGGHRNRILHGECKHWYKNGQLCDRTFHYHGKWHGEYRFYGEYGELREHSFYINGDYHPYVEMSEHEKLLFQIQHPGFRFIED